MNIIWTGLLLLASLLACTAVTAAEAPPPALDCQNGHWSLRVDGKPFLILGGQVHNSTTADAERLDRACTTLARSGANTAFVPISWELLEPAAGQYDFALVDRAVQDARKHHLRLVLLWFGGWKNGAMHYAPEWVKRDKTTYPRVIDARGGELPTLSPLSEATRRADAAAFRAMMTHLREIDGADHTVLLVQVENEAGYLGADRDYSPAATQRFEGPVPSELTAYLDAHRAALSAPLARAWGESGNRLSGTWTEVFGDMAAEACTGWDVARYVDAVTVAGKEAWPLPMYANAWLAVGNGERAGVWPSGGPNENMIDLWKCAAPHLDFLAPDIYQSRFADICAAYARPDNPLFIPEVSFDPYYPAFAFTAFAGCNSLAFSPFGIDEEGDEPSPAAVQWTRVYGVLRPLLPLIAERQHSGTLFPFAQNLFEEGETTLSIQLGEQLAAVITYTVKFDALKQRGAGMIVRLARDEYLVAGMGFNAVLRELQGPPRDAEILSLDEGTYDEGAWKTQHRLNGDELQLSLPETGRILRVKLLR